MYNNFKGNIMRNNAFQTQYYIWVNLEADEAEKGAPFKNRVKHAIKITLNNSNNVMSVDRKIVPINLVVNAVYSCSRWYQFYLFHATFNNIHKIY